MARRRRSVPKTGFLVEGGEELKEALNALGEHASGTYLLHAVRRGGEITRDVAEQLAPRSATGSKGRAPGHLAANITMVDETATPTLAEVSVGTERTAFYGFFQEAGTRYHPAQPFLRPAADETQESVVEQIRETLEALIASELNTILKN